MIRGRCMRSWVTATGSGSEAAEAVSLAEDVSESVDSPAGVPGAAA